MDKETEQEIHQASSTAPPPERVILQDWQMKFTQNGYAHYETVTSILAETVNMQFGSLSKHILETH